MPCSNRSTGDTHFERKDKEPIEEDIQGGACNGGNHDKHGRAERFRPSPQGGKAAGSAIQRAIAARSTSRFRGCWRSVVKSYCAFSPSYNWTAKQGVGNVAGDRDLRADGQHVAADKAYLGIQRRQLSVRLVQRRHTKAFIHIQCAENRTTVRPAAPSTSTFSRRPIPFRGFRRRSSFSSGIPLALGETAVIDGCPPFGVTLNRKVEPIQLLSLA